jgi:hypothetical protein
MHYLLDIQNVKIYIKMLYSRSYKFRSSTTIIRELHTVSGLSNTLVETTSKICGTPQITHAVTILH